MTPQAIAITSAWLVVIFAHVPIANRSLVSECENVARVDRGTESDRTSSTVDDSPGATRAQRQRAGPDDAILDDRERVLPTIHRVGDVQRAVSGQRYLRAEIRCRGQRPGDRCAVGERSERDRVAADGGAGRRVIGWLTSRPAVHKWPDRLAANSGSREPVHRMRRIGGVSAEGRECRQVNALPCRWRVLINER